MGKRYYCDYCDRSFKDDPEARKKHLSSLQHARNRADHYSFFKDPETILREETAKTPCKRFMTQGECAFGHGCRFSHFTPPMLWQLQQMVNQKNQGGAGPTNRRYRPDPNDIIKEFLQESILADNTRTEIDYPVWSVPPELLNYVNLPPSLWPITAASVTDSDFAKWGL